MLWKNNILIKKWGISKDNINIASRYMVKCPTSWIARGMQIKTPQDATPQKLRWLLPKTLKKKVDKVVEKKDMLYIVDGNTDWYS